MLHVMLQLTHVMQTEFHRRSFEYGGGMMWNSLPNHLHEMNSF